MTYNEMKLLSRRSFITSTAGSLIASAALYGNSRPSRAAERQPGAKAMDRFDVERFVDEVRKARGESDSQRAIKDVLGRAMSNPREVMLGLGEPSAAGAQTLYNDQQLTVLNIVWAPLMLLLPHDHNMWALIGIYTGREDNILWQPTGNTVTASGARALARGDVYDLPHDAIHSVTNPIKKLTGAIHIYGGDFFEAPRSEWDAGTLIKRPFRLEQNMNMFREADERFNCLPQSPNS